MSNEASYLYLNYDFVCQKKTRKTCDYVTIYKTYGLDTEIRARERL